MTTVNEPPDAPDVSPLGERDPGRPVRSSAVGRVAVVLLLIGIGAMWVYAFSPWARRDPPGELEDPAFSRAAEPVCARAMADLADLPPAFESPSPQARAAVIEDSNDRLDAMLAELAGFVPVEEPDGLEVEEWLADWGVYVEDRRELAAELAEGRDARMRETARGGDHISEALDFFADVNGMPSCMTPHDVG